MSIIADALSRLGIGAPVTPKGSRRDSASLRVRRCGLRFATVVARGRVQGRHPAGEGHPRAERESRSEDREDWTHALVGERRGGHGVHR
jgi:hypothetical protein